MVILVTGCAGFIGSHLCESLLKTSNHVIGVDNLNNYYDQRFKQRNLEILGKYPNFKFIQEDIRTTDAIVQYRPDAVYHLAGMAGVRYSIENPELYMDVNVTGFVHLLEQAKQVKCPVYYASSSSVYGTNAVPFREDDNTVSMNSPYAVSKHAMDMLAKQYCRNYDMKVVGMRFFTVYGPRGRPDMAPYKFLKAIHEQTYIAKYGNGTSTRDYTYISDIVDGILLIGEKSPHGYNIYNIGSSHPVTLDEFIAECERTVGKKALVKSVEEQQGDVPHTYANIDKLKLLGFSPKISLMSGLRLTYENCINLGNNA